jgi:uncharacterized protein with NRDE domain
MVSAGATTTESGFLSPAAAWMGADPSGVQAALDHKEATTARCRTKIRPCWLLVVAFGNVLEAQIADFDEVAAADYRSSFDRAYLMDIFTQSCARLRLRPV